MKTSGKIVLLLCVLISGCAILSEKSRMDRFSRIAGAFENALLHSDYNAAAKFIDPSVPIAKPDLLKMKNIKILEYRITRINVSENKQRITQDVELQYFRLNSNRLRNTRYPQVWVWRQKDNIWLLQTGFPSF